MTKEEVASIDAKPSKKLFLSIIADYDLNRSICELIDNAIDIWIKNGRNGTLDIQINLDLIQKTISISDWAGGVKKEDMSVLVGPGQTTNTEDDEVIGIFGVGAKRAVVALSQDVKISSRYGRGKTYRIEFDDAWLQTDEWRLKLYRVDDIGEGMTIIELQKLRFDITKETIQQLEEHLRVTYSRFLSKKQVKIILNENELEPRSFEEGWVYPAEYSPYRYTWDQTTKDNETVKVEIVAGLTKESNFATGEYGVYFYCNDRLIARALKDFNVGFTKGLAGKPHSDVSLFRAIVSLRGKAKLMPWNSSKSGINPNSRVFVAIHGLLIEIVTRFASLSRRLGREWSETASKYTEGDIVEVGVQNPEKAEKSYFPTLPVRKRWSYAGEMEKINRKIVEQKPWSRGLYEGIVAVGLIFKERQLEQKNRIGLIILDSTLEIAFKEFLVYDSGEEYSDDRLANIFKDRFQVHNEIQKHTNFNTDLWKKIKHYYVLRCKLIHERSTGGVTDDQIEDYRKVVQKVLKQLFKLKFVRESN
jgi:hypothetical protein